MVFRSLCTTLTLGAVLAIAGEARAQDDELVGLILGLLADPDKDIRSLAHEQVRTAAKGRAATEKFAAQLPNLPSDAQVGLLSALGDRGDPAAKPAVLNLLEASNDDSISVASIVALGKLGGSSECNVLVARLASNSKAQQDAARQAMIQLRGDAVATESVREFKSASLETKIKLIEILATRRALDTIPDLLGWAVGDDGQIRAAAMTALGQLASQDEVAGMVRGVLKAAKGAERAAAERNVMLVCHRSTKSKDARALPLLKAMQGLSSSEQIAMLSTLGRVGGAPALIVANAAISTRDAAVHSAGIIALANWPDASVAAQLVELAKTDEHASHREIALRAIIRIAPLPDGRTDQEKLELLKTAMGMCNRDADRIYALKRASAIRLVETLRFVLPYTDQSKFAETACQTIVELAHHRQLRDDNKTEFHQALDKVIATSTDATVLDRADRYKRGQTWVRPKK